MVWVLTELRLVDLRQMFATIALGSGESVTAVQEQLGHSSPMTDLPPENWSREYVRNWAIGLAPILIPVAMLVSRFIEQPLGSSDRGSSGRGSPRRRGDAHRCSTCANPLSCL